MEDLIKSIWYDKLKESTIFTSQGVKSHSWSVSRDNLGDILDELNLDIHIPEEEVV
jgi:hypothetical protein